MNTDFTLPTIQNNLHRKSYDIHKVAALIHNKADLIFVFHNILKEQGLGDWDLVFDRAIRRLGQCRYTKREIGLGESYTRLMFEAGKVIELVRTFLHEVGHALTPNAGHGYEWRKACRLLGLDDVSVTHRWNNPDDSPSRKIAKYKLVHKDTGEVFKYYINMPRNWDCSHLYIKGRKGETLGKLVIKVIG